MDGVVQLAAITRMLLMVVWLDSVEQLLYKLTLIEH